MADRSEEFDFGDQDVRARSFIGTVSGTVSSDDVTVPAFTADNVTFAGGTLTEALQAIADAVPAAA